MAYVTRRGVEPRQRTTANTPLPWIEAPDDGSVVVRLGGLPLRCSDCAGRGTLARTGAVGPTGHNPSGVRPWWKICDFCGAHWDEATVAYYLLPDNSIRFDGGDERLDIGFGGGKEVALNLDERVSAKGGAPTHRAILQSVPPRDRGRLFESVRTQYRDAHEFFKGPYPRVPLPASWARRARFHPITIENVTFDPRAVTPEGILAYFERLSVQQSRFDEWAEGAEATREWIELMRGGIASQERVDALVGRIRGKTPSMFHQLGLEVERWARSTGWRVP
jgi:hypothetical protein